MRILHTADLHLGQILYQCYGREEEHDHFFQQLRRWCGEHRPDALLLSGDIFDIQQPSAAVRSRFNDYFVSLHKAFPEMSIVVTAGNHDSASRIQADSSVWSLGNIHLIGTPPPTDRLTQTDWCDDFIIEMPNGFIIALPFMAATRTEIFQRLLDHVAERNTRQLPVVMMAHLAVSNSDFTGHSDIGKIQIQQPEEIGKGYDYLALGHIHRPQTLGFPPSEQSTTYPAGVIRYSGSALHVSCDEAYPHSVSMVDIDRHQGNVTVTPLRIDELLHFYTLPEDGPATSCEHALASVRQFIRDGRKGYIRLCIDYQASLPADFTTQVYALIEPHPDVRYNPKTLWHGQPAIIDSPRPTFQVAELTQMTDPKLFIEKTIDQYPELTAKDEFGVSLFDQLSDIFEEIEQERRQMDEEDALKSRNRKKNSTMTNEAL